MRFVCVHGIDDFGPDAGCADSPLLKHSIHIIKKQTVLRGNKLIQHTDVLLAADKQIAAAVLAAGGVLANFVDDVEDEKKGIAIVRSNAVQVCPEFAGLLLETPGCHQSIPLLH